jgi:3-deoxy-D-manno-octulosonic-acid transferase
MTTAGRDAARRRIPGAMAYALAPLDSAWVVRRFLRTVAPALVLIAETELWPNYFIEARRFGSRVAIINGRISARSLGRYQWAQSLFAQALGCADLILAQTEDDARRYQWLGAAAENIVVSGNTKYDLEASTTDDAPRPELEAFAIGRPLLVAGSTAPGEEQIVLDAYLSLLKRFPDLALVLAPRHLNRVPAVEAAVQSAGLPHVNATQLKSEGGEGAAIPGVLILDTMGELRGLYRRAAVAFVGGSIAPGRGGQNLAEPAAACVPVLFGPFHSAQEEMATALVKANGARVVNDSGQLADASAAWLCDESLRVAAGHNANEALKQLAASVTPTLMRLKALASLD